MEEEQKSALRKCRVRMVSDINIDQMMDVFDSRELFTPIMMEYIKVCLTVLNPARKQYLFS